MNETPAGARLNVAEAPHWRDASSLAQMQVLWLVALSPAAIASVTLFGQSALRVIALAVGASVALDVAANRVLGAKDSATNWSSVTLGLLLALLLPVGAPWWLVVVGCFLTVVVGKKLYGGWGGYPVHPVALGYAMLAVSWPERLDRTASLVGQAWDTTMIEPVRLLKTQGAAAEAAYAKVDLLLGIQVGGIGNALVLWLLLGGFFLLLVRQISWQIPAGALAGVVLGAVVVRLAAPAMGATPLFHLLAGSTVLTGCFLLTEVTTSPVNPWPMAIYGMLGGLLLVLIRVFSTNPEEAIFAVMLANLAAPLLDRLAPRARGLEVARDA
ncbi:MAG TPA: RnfABCDGE type electron transport complex subunit D [Candidatus Krumholzibacteria bacterium]|nr:RnfABCDGE type electron transport complex subunit D [Candidatus Krumholzibacteria bacterium]HPD72652.1 RnfABCDGE type electron transport complex subunit D [Candidatus Krumholzibacteria bacterium]HRY40416.1 RnfABCDGE type electron transport complex subunit D [Candidatus Krumholzibacteria bacterium]